MIREFEEVTILNEALKAARVAKGFTQAQMATYLGYKSKSGYCMIERGNNRPTLLVALKIAELLNQPISSLFSELKVHESSTTGNTA